jgi:glycosyltransferase involved in cell wall biosynthesis
MREAVIVVPCYNEEKRFDPERYAAFVDAEPVDFIFVDDGSGDGTAAALARTAARRPGRMRVVTMPENVGKAEAVRQGVLVGLADGYPVVGYWDADDATPLTALPTMLATLRASGATLLMGSRVRLMGRRIERKMGRHYLGRIFATAVSLALGITVYDTQCGAKLFKNDATTQRAFAEPFITRWVFDVELLARLARELPRHRPGVELDDAVIEYPLESWRDVPGSKLRPAHMATAALDIVRIYLRYGRGR